jgi:hypothetical protein
MKAKIDRGINPHDGSRRRLKSTAHKSAKDYDRNKSKKEIKIITNSN